MIRICFICLGNICRSPMAEFIMKEKIKKLGLSNQFLITSRATSYEESGNDIYPPAKETLDKNNIPYTKHKATRVEEKDYNNFDYFICMEKENVKNLSYIFSDYDNKVSLLLERDISDPWYLGNFTKTYNDLDEGITNLIDKLRKNL